MKAFLQEWFDSKVDRRTVLIALIVAILISTASVVFGLIGELNRPIVIVFTGVLLVALFITYRGNITFGRWLIPFTAYLVITLLVYRGGIRDVSTLAFTLVILIAGLFLGEGGGILIGILSALTTFVIGYSEATGVINNYLSAYTFLPDAIMASVFILGLAILQVLVVRRLSNSLREAEKRTLAEQNANLELRELQETLEKRISERTNDLETTTLAIERRASQLQAVSDVARSIATVQDASELLPTIARVISQFFGFYHVGIFLLDENSEYAELRAANSEGGKRMLERGHRLRVGYQGVVGFAARQGRARIALDTGEDAVFFDNPDLPTTHSEAALPLVLGDEVIGVLDVQSEEPEAFAEDDIEVLNTLAYQVATAIQNARLYGQLRRALEEANRTSSQQIIARWSNYGVTGQRIGYRFDGSELDPIMQPVDFAEMNNALDSGTEQNTAQMLAIPIKLRGETIGVIGLKAKENRRPWSPSEITMAQAAAERAALSLENARLVEEAQRRASLERLTAEISGKIGASVQYKSIMRIAAEELSRALGSEVLVQISGDTQNLDQ